MSDEQSTADLITLADAIEKIGQFRHGLAWATAAANELQATEEARAGSNTIKNVREAQERVKILRRPIDLEILDKLGRAQLSAHWRDSNGKLLPIASGHWNAFEVEANRYWPKANIERKPETVYLHSASLEIFITQTTKAKEVKAGRPSIMDEIEAELDKWILGGHQRLISELKAYEESGKSKGALSRALERWAIKYDLKSEGDPPKAVTIENSLRNKLRRALDLL